MRTVNIGLLGLGTVGAGTVEVLQRNAEEISRRAGCHLNVTRAAVKSLDKSRDCDTSNIAITTDPNNVINDPDIDIIVEVMGGTSLANDCVTAAIKASKQVVTANKALIAANGNELFQLANEQGVSIAFEAAVAGGIPIIKVLREGLAGNRIRSVCGIINGTCNYILSNMRDTGRAFDVVLAEAKEKGYAEAAHHFDVDGLDARDKLVIIASIAFGMPLNLEACYLEGIGDISAADIENAKQLGYDIKLLGIAQKVDANIEMRVHPCLVKQDSLLAHVNGVMNAVMVEADAVGTTLYYGAGAGAEATASAVVADIVDVARNLNAAPEHRVPSLGFQFDQMASQHISDITEITTGYYLQLQALDKPGTLAAVTQILSEQSISIESIMQKHDEREGDYVPIVLITDTCTEGQMDEALKQLLGQQDLITQCKRIRLF